MESLDLASPSTTSTPSLSALRASKVRVVACGAPLPGWGGRTAVKCTQTNSLVQYLWAHIFLFALAKSFCKPLGKIAHVFEHSVYAARGGRRPWQVTVEVAVPEVAFHSDNQPDRGSVDTHLLTHGLLPRSSISWARWTPS